jgi:hypothetical protein
MGQTGERAIRKREARGEGKEKGSKRSLEEGK